MAYTTINKSTDYFNTKLYTGNGSYGHSITGVGFEPSLVWIKGRSNADNHNLYDAVRGTDKGLRSNTNDAEFTGVNLLHSFDSDGFTVDDHTPINRNGGTIASWNWKANGAGSANTDGSINSTVSVNQTAGFSIVKWTGTQSLGTVGHGLNATPDVILIKNVSAGENWIMYHVGLGGNTKNLYLDATNAVDTRTDTFNSTSPTSSVFTVNTATGVNKTGSTMMAYCFTSKTGYSKFGSYNGNGNANGTFVYTGFKPKFLMVKGYAGTDNWVIFDDERLGYNDANYRLYPNLTAAEEGGGKIDILSNGFKAVSTWGSVNDGGGSYIYMAIGQSLVGSNNVPCTAR